MRLFFFLTVSFFSGGSAILSAEWDRYGGNTAIRAEATGWFRVEEIEGRWFWITPEGNAFFSLGITHTGETIRQDELGVFASRFENDEEKMGGFFLERMRNWGFNSAGYGGLAMMEQRIPYVATIWTEGPRSRSAGAKSKNTDLFDPVVQARLRKKVREAAERHLGNRFCLGYVFIDLPIWSLEPDPGESYVAFLQSLPESAPGRVALEEYRRKHGDADTEALMNHIADTYYTIVCGELRRIDPHHLILGDRLMTQPASSKIHTPDSILKTAARHVDVLSFQPMGTRQPIRAYLDHVHALTGKPVLLADVNTMTMRPAKGVLDTTRYETEAGEHTLTYYLDAAASPACLGLHRCTMRDYFAWDPQFHRRGLLRANDTEYSILVDYTRRTNREVFARVYALDR